VAFRVKVDAGVDKNSGLIHSVVVTPANVHDLTPAAQLLHGDEEVVCDDAGYQVIAKRPEMAGKTAELRLAMRPSRSRALPDSPYGKMKDLIETAKAHILSKDEYIFRAIKQRFGFQKTRLRSLAKNRCKIHAMAALSNLFQARRQLLATA
jgi:transposase, IS5 family